MSFHPDQIKLPPLWWLFYLVCAAIRATMLHYTLMKLTTLNLQGYFDWQERESNIIKYLESTKPDIILFQEVVFLPSISYESQPAVLNKKLGYPYENISIPRLQDSPHFPEYREGLAVLSRLPITKSEVLTLKKHPEDEHQRIVQLIDVTQDDITIKLANVHLSVEDRFSKLQIEEFFEILRARGETRIIGGDFNIPDLNGHSFIWQDNYTATADHDYISFPAKNNKIDYFLVPKQYELKTIETSNGDLSDHLAVTSTIKI